MDVVTDLVEDADEPAPDFDISAFPAELREGSNVVQLAAVYSQFFSGDDAGEALVRRSADLVTRSVPC